MSEPEAPPDEGSLAEKYHALVAVATYRPALTAAIVLLSIVTTLLEGIGIGFLLPIIEYAQSDSTAEGESDALLELFVTAYQFLGIPFTLEFVVFGMAVVLTVRIGMGFLVGWFVLRLSTNYVRELQTEAFDRTLDARLQYFDQHGSDTVLNELVTRVYYAESVLEGLIGLFQQSLLVLMYLAIAFYLAPTLTVVLTGLLVALAFAVRVLPERAYAIGQRVTTAHEQIQSTVQAGTQGIQDVKLFEMDEELLSEFRSSVDQYTRSTIAFGRNELAIENAYHLVATLLVVVVLYLAITYASLGLGSLGVFVFVVYRLGPQINGLNAQIYQLQGSLPHVVRLHRFLGSLRAHQEPTDAAEPLPDTIERLAFENVSFGYGTEPVVQDVSFSLDRGEFIAFVGPSGAGKSTIAALLARLYEPDEGRITANGLPSDRFGVTDWRSRIAVVPQQPYIFDETLRYNVTFGSPDATDADVERACEAAQVTEFLDELPDGYDTELGDDGVRLSGGQRQRVAVARALLYDADVLVFDEATSDLDTTLEERIFTAIESLDGRYTVLVITHRLGTVVDADRIHAIEDGRLTEAGDHRELLTNDGTYSELIGARSREPETL